jgi:NDP-sugar pyrophosphorylase family protein
MLTVVILAGGLATRIRPITEELPKSLIPVAGKTFIEHQLAYLHREGVDNVVICVGYLGELIEKIVGDGSRFGLKISYSYDGEKLLGTGGAVRNALPLLKSDFFILYGDSFLPVNFRLIEQFYLSSKKQGLMTVFKNDNQWDKSNVIFHQGELIEYNKNKLDSRMAYIDYGLAILNVSAFNDYPMGDAFDLANLYNDLSLKGQLVGFEVHERFYEIGSFTGIRDAELFFIDYYKKELI